ncbi:MAG: xanthine dehydrogenase family protein molybdopterin-binding subunit [Myxococcota bacterium]
MKTAIGQAVSRIDGRLKTTGAALYTADQRPAHDATLHAVLVKATIGAGKIEEFDTSEAEAMAGFVRFLSHQDGALIRTVENPSDGSFAAGEAYTPFENDRVYFVGQHIGVAIAESLEVAEAAATSIKVTYRVDEPKAAFPHPEAEVARPTLYNTGEELQVSRGNVDAELAQSKVTVTQTYSTPAETHNPIEPSATLAYWDNDRLVVYDATQGNINDRNYLAWGMRVEPDAVRVLNPFIGGGFGCKGFAWPHALIAAAASRVVDRPVLLVLSRADMYTSCGHRPQTQQKLTLGASSDGRFTAIRHHTRSYRSLVGDHMEPCGTTTSMLYRCDNVEIRHENEILHRPSATPMRGPGEANGTFALECAIDELAESLGIDPIELRRRNYADTDQRNARPWSSNHLLECYSRGAERIGWKKRRSAGQWREGDNLIGLGMATSCYPGYRMPAQTQLELHADGRVKVSVSVQDIGTGLYTILAQMVSERLGVPIADIEVKIGDTELPAGPLAGGSMTTASVSASVDAACAALQREIHKRISQTEVKTDDCRSIRLAKDAIVFNEHTLAIASILRSDESLLSVTAGSDVTYGFAGGAETTHSFYSFGAIFAEVRVDRDYGIIRVPRIVGVFDVGRVINASTARSQMIGGMTFGIGMALLEETFFDPKTGRVINPSLGEYYVPVNADVHDIEVEMLDIPDFDFNPFGARGIGEIGNVGASAAIANAVSNATGVRVRSLPIRLDDLMGRMNR